MASRDDTDELALDLTPPPDDPWRSLVVPDGWEPVAEMCTTLASRIDALADTTADAIAEEFPDYATYSGHDDLIASIRRNFEMMLVGIAERRGPTEEELQVRRALGRRRAVQGAPIDLVLRAYNIGYRELWRELIETAEAQDPQVAQRLLRASGTAWQWVHEVTSAVTEAHSEVARARAELTAGVRRRLLELLMDPEPDERELADVARSLGHEPAAAFQVWAARTEGHLGHIERAVEDALSSAGVAATCIARGRTWVVVTQPVDTDHATAVQAAIAAALGPTACGVGGVRTGVLGARESLVEADRALELADRRGGTVAFDDDWFAIALLRDGDGLRGVLETGVAVAQQQPALALTVTAFADARFSVSAAGRALDVHANTVKYRLERWRELTGWDPQTFDGLVRSIAAIERAAAAGGD